MSNVRVVILMSGPSTVVSVKEHTIGSNEPVDEVLNWLHGPNGYAKGREAWTRRTRVRSAPWADEPVGYIEWQHYYIDSSGFVQNEYVVEPPKFVLMQLLMRNL